MRNMSFALTMAEIIAGTKTVTRRLGWADLRAGERVQPVKKGMGLKLGERVERLRGPVLIVSARREPLRAVLDDDEYGRQECIFEGFPELTPAQFVEMFCATHRGCTPVTDVTRIEFSYE